MTKCRLCGSFAINPHLHNRNPKLDLDICDVCYWQTRAITPIFAWYDFWIGLFYDRIAHSLYIFPFPMFGLKIQLKTPKGNCGKCKFFHEHQNYMSAECKCEVDTSKLPNCFHRSLLSNIEHKHTWKICPCFQPKHVSNDYRFNDGS